MEPTILDVSLTTLNLTALDFDGNRDAIAAVLNQLDANASDGGDAPGLRVVVFPELATTGPGCADAFLRPAVLKAAAESLLSLEAETPPGFVATFGLPIAFNGAVYKGTAFVADGAIRGFVCATSIPNDGRDAARQFACWPRGRVERIEFAGRELPIGDLTFAERGVVFAVRTLDEAARDAGVRLGTFFAPKTFDEKTLYAVRENGKKSVDAAEDEAARPARTPKSIDASRRERFVPIGGFVEDGEFRGSFPAERSVDCVLCPSATPFAMGRQAKIRRILETLSRRDGNLIVYSTPVGVESGTAIYDGGSAIALNGEVCQNGRFPFVPATFATNRVEIGTGDDGRREVDWGYSEFCELGSDLEDWETGANDSGEPDADGDDGESTGDVAESVKFEEFARATSYAILDYMRKSRSRGLALSLSGGADSATIATLVRLGVKFGCRQIGARLFLRWLVRYYSENGSLQAFPALAKLDAEAFGDDDAFDVDDWEEVDPSDVEREGNEFNANAWEESQEDDSDEDDELDERESEIWLDGEDDDELERAIVGVLLKTAYQATRNSGDVTREAARAVAAFCGSTHFEFDVDKLVEGYKATVAEATETPFSWAKDDLALQNIQARTRAPGIWLLANRDGRLLLSTGNRSEVACGYATMDGDTAGGLSPIAGVDKAFIRKWLRWEEKIGVSLGEFDSDADDEEGENGELGFDSDADSDRDVETDVDADVAQPAASTRFTAPALRLVNEQQPTAELRPAEAKQTDEADLMPYTVLNLFERALIRDRLELGDAFRRVAAETAAEGLDVDSETLFGWGLRFCRLWTASQWKRERYAPGFALDDYDLSPESWTRFPILSAGFQREIDALEARRV